MKEGFEKSSKVKHTKSGGWYLTIPFRFAGAGALGENEIFSGVLPKAVQSAVKNLVSNKGEFKTSVKFGDSLKAKDIPDAFKEPKTRAAFSDITSKKTFEQYVHKTSIYEGVGQSSKTYQNATQSMFNSFRRVSSNSDPNSWINSGIRAHNLAEKSLNNFNIGHEVDIAVDSQLVNLGF